MKWIITAKLLLTFFFAYGLAYAEDNADRTAQQAVGKIILASKSLTATNQAGEERVLKRGDEIFIGDTLKTSAGRVQIRFIDDANLSLRPNSELNIEEYFYKTKGKKNSSVMKLLKGGFRTITGAITEESPDSYKIKTPVAVMSIRGTTYTASLVGDSLGVEFISGSKTITIQNRFGKVDLYAGGPKVATVQSGGAPQQSGSLPQQFKGGNPCS